MTVSRVGAVDGADVFEVTLANAAGAQARILSFGAVLRDLLIPHGGGLQRPILALENVEDYLARRVPYLGAIVGRYANRIAGARFSLDGKTHRLEANENGNQLHGGPSGFSSRLWTIIDHGGADVTLALVSGDGDMGYPGRLVATCRYALHEPATLRLTLESTCDRATPVNLSTHAYFNLDAAEAIGAHRLRIAGGYITPTRADLIPTGEIRAVDGGPYDFRASRLIAAGQAGVPAYDINYVLDGGEDDLALAAVLESDRNGLGVELWTTEPGVQFYDGHLLDCPVPTLGGIRLRPHAGLCLEPQRFPDGPNEPHFPPCILEPGSVSRQVSEFRFRSRETS